MKIRYLGTAAYEGVPALFCQCDVCRRSRLAGGRNLRTRQQALLNDDLLFDFNADTVCHMQRYGLDLGKNITECLITHSHCDHLYPDDAEIAAEPYSHGHSPIHFYAARDGYEKLLPFTKEKGIHAGVTLVQTGKEFTTAGGYCVLPLPADHDPASSPVIYAVRKAGRRILYAHDTGMFPDETFAGLQTFGRLDLISFDCTGCLGLNGAWRQGHMSLETIIEVFARLCALGVADKSTVKVLSHFSHNGGQTYDEMLAAAEREGYVVAYDGLEIEF